MKTLEIEQVAANLYRIDPPIILDENSRTRRLFFGELARNQQGEWHVRGSFIVERKSKSGWQNLDTVAIGDLKAGELAKLELRSEHVRRLLAGLEILAETAERQGASLRPARKVIVGKDDEIIRIVEKDHKAVVQELISQNRTRDFWGALAHAQPDLASQLADAELQRKRKLALNTFETEMQNRKWTEPQWEKFFIQNTWIFGYGLRYQFLSVLQNQANYGGADFTRKGGQRGEFLMNTEAQRKFTVIVEIKRPDSPIFDSDSRQYRSGVPSFSTEFVDAISQVNVNTRTWDTEGSKREGDREKLSRAGVHTITPRAILVYGNTSEAEDFPRQRAFELFRRNLHSPDIIGFDELLERARFIVVEGDELQEPDRK